MLASFGTDASKRNLWEALVGWEEWGKRQTGNGKGKHELAGPV